MVHATTAVFTEQSRFSRPGRCGSIAIDTLAPDVAALQEVANRLVFHYRAGGDWAANGVGPARLAEIDTRYADLMFERLLALRPGLAADRTGAERTVGCCRDFTLLFVSMARHHGIPARARVGFAGYLLAGWWIDHVVAEVWHPAERRWRLVEAQLATGHVDPTDGTTLDVLDVDRQRFLTGGDAWRACRSGAADPERFVVDPGLEEPVTRSWPQLATALRLDLASLNRQEMLQWDEWGVVPDPGPRPDDVPRLLDEVAAVVAAPDPDPAELARWLGREEFRVPQTVTSFSPAAGPPPVKVELRP